MTYPGVKRLPAGASAEVGLGIVPQNALARRFRDAAGTLNQSVVTVVEAAAFMAAGLPVQLK